MYNTLGQIVQGYSDYRSHLVDFCKKKKQNKSMSKRSKLSEQPMSYDHDGRYVHLWLIFFVFFFFFFFF